MRDDPNRPDAGALGSPSEERLLLRAWGESEALVVRQLLDQYGIRSRLVCDLSRAVMPLSVDRFGEVRVMIPVESYDEAVQLLAEHRREGLSLAPDETGEAPPRTGTGGS